MRKIPLQSQQTATSQFVEQAPQVESALNRIQRDMLRILTTFDTTALEDHKGTFYRSKALSWCFIHGDDDAEETRIRSHSITYANTHKFHLVMCSKCPTLIVGHDDKFSQRPFVMTCLPETRAHPEPSVQEWHNQMQCVKVDAIEMLLATQAIRWQAILLLQNWCREFILMKKGRSGYERLKAYYANLFPSPSPPQAKAKAKPT